MRAEKNTLPLKLDLVVELSFYFFVLFTGLFWVRFPFLAAGLGCTVLLLGASRSLTARKRLLPQTPFDKVFLFLPIPLGFSYWAAVDKRIALLGTSVVILAILFFYFVVANFDTPPKLSRALWILILSSVIVSGYGLYQFYDNYRLYGQFPDLGQVEGTNVDEFRQFEETRGRYAISSTFGHRNNLSWFLVTTSSIAFLLFLTVRKLLLKIFLSIAFLLQGVTLVLSFSRGGWIQFAVTFLMMGYFYALFKTPRIWKIVLITALLFIVASGTFSIITLWPYLPDVFAHTLIESNRYLVWQASWYMFQDFPYTGVGIGNFPIIYSFYGILSGQSYVQHPHNIFLWVAVETGIFGFVLFLALIIKGFLWMVSTALNTKDRFWFLFNVVMLGNLMGIIVHGMID